ncbi:P-loop containing nucleoside triphosphate hydrolase protein [Panaeolus papilionaceus]|nr:P-loop containing nucleoside triphosphate hydrolase protein [Panaeolus papilionaceus]
MKRQTNTQQLAVSTSDLESRPYELEVSPRNSIESDFVPVDIDAKHDPSSSSPTPAAPSSSPSSAPSLQPSLKLLFSLLSRRHVCVLLIPAIFSSLVSGGIAPFMTFVIGQAFDAFATYPNSPASPDFPPTKEAKDALLRGVGLAALQLLGLAVGSIALGSVTSSLWIWTGEVNVRALRRMVFRSMMNKEMSWFDSNMGTSSNEAADENSNGPVGAAGHMAKFQRETDEVRSASSLASGLLVQSITTTIACLILAFMRSWALTLVILSAVPLLIFIQGLSQGFANPLLAYEREQTAVAATIVDRAVAAISTVKAFNAQSFEVRRAKAAFNSLTKAASKLNALWATTSGLSQFVMFAMFVQGFWFGAKLVRDGRVSAGDVMAVFWACLIATTNLQMCIPHLITLAKGKFAMVAMLSLVDDLSASPESSSKPSYRSSTASSVDAPPSPTTRSSQFGFLQSFKPTTSSSPRTLRKITPSKCHGELALHNITFAYPSRPSIPVLSNVSLFLPAHEMTFIVGSSGSGKSSVGALLMRMYDPQEGMVTLDERDVRFLEEQWVREQVGAVQQGGCVLLDGRSVFENVVAGLGMDLEGLRDVVSGDEDGERVMREEVEDACRAALMHDFVRDMPQGYDTVLGGGSGVGLSGGQKQRLAIARAKLRNPTVLILDEATSALDSTSRILVFEALKRWRSNKTTIVITHDLSQISPNDFVYVLKQGRVAEQGYRYDLEMVFGGEDEDRGEFRKMMDVQAQMGGFLPEKDVEMLAPSPAPEDVEDLYESDDEDVIVNPVNLKHQSLAIRPLTFGNWMFDVIADLTAKPVAVPAPAVVNNRPSQYRISRFVPFEAFVGSNAIDEEKPQPQGRQRRPSSIHLEMPASPVAARFSLTPSKRYSLPFTPTSATFTIASSNPFAAYPSEKKYVEEEEDEEEKAFNNEKYAVEMSGATARKGREARELQVQRRGWASEANLNSIVVEPRSNTPMEQDDEPRPSFLRLSRVAFSTLPSKPILFIGLTFCLLSGAMTPLFSFLLSRLLFEVSIGARNVSVINMFGGIVLGVAALDGIFLACKYAIMEGVANGWAERVRGDAFGGVVRQDRKWFDASPAASSATTTSNSNEKAVSASTTDLTESPKEKAKEASSTIDNTPARIVQIIVKDADDARNLISIVWAQCIVVTAMLSVGLLWALIRGWELTLAGFAIAPVFAGVMAVQSRLVAKCEVRNKRAREEVSRGYYEAIVNVRGIRSMALGGIFEAQFERAAKRALQTGVRGAFVEGCTYGVASGLIYFAEALLFYVGAVLIVKGRYSYLQMVEVLNLVVFTVTIGSQLMAFTEKIAKSTQATSDLHKLMNLPTSTDESKGSLKPTINGSIQFADVTFTYPERPTAPVLKSIDLSINAGEWVAIVGPSGSGKSTITALLQRLYEPSQGRITIDGIPLSDIQTSHLREQVSVVSQSPNLFDASVEENIRYGSYGVTPTDVRKAAKKAMVHEFVMGLPMGYDTTLGENAALVSGGQAQRLQIARALARPSRVLILDECTSALDPENQALVMESIRSAAAGEGEEGGKRTTVMVTHKMEVMQMCDRIVVVQDGEIVEEGRFEELVRRKGVFATLANGGEWVG